MRFAFHTRLVCERMARSVRLTESPVWMSAVVVAAVFIAYLPAYHAGFIWDDNAHLTSAALRSWSGLWRIWSEVGATQQYYPLLHSAFWIEHQLWGDFAPGYHLVNVAWHAIAALLAGLVLYRLAIPGAWAAALLFAVHPVQVESVAWVSEQKNTLAAVFYFGAAFAYLRFDSSRWRRHYCFAFALFVLGLLTKTTVATLPPTLLVVFWWKRGELSWRSDILPVMPWLAAGIAAGLFTAWVEARVIGAAGADYALSLLQRALLAARVIWFYLGNLFWPTDLIFMYPRWTISSGEAQAWFYLLGIIAISLLLIWWARTRSRAPLAAWLVFIGTLFPVLGFLDVYPFRYSYVADHFQYLAMLAPISFVVSTAATFSVRLPRGVMTATVSILILGLGVLTWQQSRNYHDAVTLYRVTVKRNPAAWMAWNNLGKELMADPSHRSETVACFERALELRPDYYEAQNNLGLALTQARRPTEAIPHLEAALRLRSDSYQTYNNLGIALASSGRGSEALSMFQRAAELNPTLPNIEENWGKALRLLGRDQEAEIHFTRAARLRSR